MGSFAFCIQVCFEHILTSDFVISIIGFPSLLGVQIVDYLPIVLHHIGNLPYNKTVFLLNSHLCYCTYLEPLYDSLSWVCVSRCITY